MDSAVHFMCLSFIFFVICEIIFHLLVFSSFFLKLRAGLLYKLVASLSLLSYVLFVLSGLYSVVCVHK